MFNDAKVVECACARVRAAVLIFTFLIAGIARADLTVPAGATTNLASGTVDLACTDLVIGGTLQVASGAINNVRNITIQGGGTLDGGSGIIQVAGNWSNSGSFVAGSGEVDFRDQCGGVAATVSGNTTFNRASFESSVGKNYVFVVGSTQKILSLLQIAGTAPNPIQFRSSAAGQVAFIDLINSGSQQIQHVGVTDVWSIGQCLAPGQSNEGGGGNAKNWFNCGGGGNSIPTKIPALDAAALLALAALLAASGMWLARSRRQSMQKRADAARHEDTL